MSQEKAGVLRGARAPLRVDPRTEQRRTLDDRIFLRLPALYRLLTRFSMWLPPRFPLRRLMLRREGERGFAAANRRDFERIHLTQDPAIEMRIRFRGGLYPPDMPRVHHGHAGYRQLWERALEAFPDLRLEPEELIDFGDRLLVTIHQRGHGTGSGVPIDERVFQLFTLREGLVIRQDDFNEWSDALEAVRVGEV